MINYFKELLIALKLIEGHLQAIRSCIRQDKYEPQIRVFKHVDRY